MVEFSSETIWDRRFPLRPSLWSITLRSRRFRFRALETILLSLLLIFTSISLWSENTFLHFTFVEVCLVTQYIIDLGICSVHTWKQCIFCSTGWSIPETIRSYRLGVLFSSSIFLLLFSLLVRLAVKKRMLKSSAIIVDVSISYFNLSVFVSHVLQLFINTYTLRIAMSFGGLILLCVSFSLFGSFIFFEINFI